MENRVTTNVGINIYNRDSQDYNQRCGHFRYYQPVMDRAQAAFEKNKEELDSLAQTLVIQWNASDNPPASPPESAPAPSPVYPANSTNNEGYMPYHPESDVQNVPSSLLTPDGRQNVPSMLQQNGTDNLPTTSGEQNSFFHPEIANEPAPVSDTQSGGAFFDRP